MRRAAAGIALSILGFAAAATADDTRPWQRAVVPSPVRARVGDVAWAAVAAGDTVRVEPFKVVAVTGNVATLEDGDRKTYPNVPGAVIQPPRGAPQKLGGLVTYFDWRHDVGIAISVKDPLYYRSQGRLGIKFRDSLDVVREESTHVVEPIASGIAPLGWVAFPSRGGMHRGLVFAVQGDSVFVRDDARHGFVVPRSDVKPLSLTTRAFSVGDAVIAYASDVGYKPATVASVFVPGFAYAVRLTGEETARPVVFSDLVERL